MGLLYNLDYRNTVSKECILACDKLFSQRNCSLLYYCHQFHAAVHLFIILPDWQFVLVATL